MTPFNKDAVLKVETEEGVVSLPLPVYYAKDQADIPYVSLNDFAAILPRLGYGMKTISGKSGVYTLDGVNTSVNVTGGKGGKFTFDTNANTIVVENIDRFASSLYPLNNGIGPDYFSRLGETNAVDFGEDTKVLQGESKVTFDLNKYGMSLYAQDGKGFAPIDLLRFIALPAGRQFIYNGVNFYLGDSMMSMSRRLLSECYSANGSFLFATVPASAEYTEDIVEFKMTDPYEGELYRFASVDPNLTPIRYLSLQKDGKVALYEEKDSKDVEIGLSGCLYRGTWKKVDSENLLELSIEATPNVEGASFESEHVDYGIRLGEGRFASLNPSKELMAFNYSLLSFEYTKLYGLSRIRSITDFDELLTSMGLLEGMKSQNIEVFNEAFIKFLGAINDGHTDFTNGSIYRHYSEASDREIVNANLKPINTTWNDATLLYGGARETAGVSEGLRISGNTAILTWDKFVANDAYNCLPLTSFASSTPNDYVHLDTTAFVASSFVEIQKHDEIENVVFDVSNNLGGDTSCYAYLLAFMTDDPTIAQDSLYGEHGNERRNEYHYRVDLNGDGVYGGEGDTFKGKYNFFVETSPATFSAANGFAGIAKNLPDVKIIGAQSSGGTSGVLDLNDALGNAWHTSGPDTLLYKNASGSYVHNESGIPVDVELDADNMYDADRLIPRISVSRS